MQDQRKLVNKVHEIFPLIVYQGSINSHEYMKKHIDVLREYWFDGYENESPEYSGRIFLHQEEYCKPFFKDLKTNVDEYLNCLLYTSPSPRDRQKSRMPSSA